MQTAIDQQENHPVAKKNKGGIDSHWADKKKFLGSWSLREESYFKDGEDRERYHRHLEWLGKNTRFEDT